MRILHVVGSMKREGIQTWLMHVLRRVDPVDYHMDFLVHTSEEAAYDKEIRDAGSLIIPCPWNHRYPPQYASDFRRAVREYGPYDILHSHLDYYSGVVLWLADSVGSEKLIAHSHNDARVIEQGARVTTRAFVNLNKWMISRYAICGLAASRKAAEFLFGLEWEHDPRWRLLFCGIDLDPFKQAVDNHKIRAELGIPAKAFVVGHVGRFYEQKNHTFLIDIAFEVAKTGADIRFLLVGDGPLRRAIEQKVERMGLQENVIFAGVRENIPSLMLGAMDAFILPSLHEGLPLTLMEAQAAGLPCIYSDVISDEADIVNYLVHRLPVEGPADIWAAEILKLWRMKPTAKNAEAIAIVENSAFNIASSVEELIRIYEGLC